MNHKDYIKSRAWLLKKNELIGTYIKEGWEIKCEFCGATDYLQVHHRNYDNLGKEVVTDYRVWDLAFLCWDCHTKWHKDPMWKDKKLKEIGLEFIEIIKELEN